jgi:hypothetical protein
MSLWDAASIYGPLLLAVMGALITIAPNLLQGKLRWGWLTGFIVVGLITAYGTYIAQRDQERKLTGGDCFLYFATYNIGRPYPLFMFSGCAPLFEVSYSIFRLHQDLWIADMTPILTRTLGTVLPSAQGPTDIRLAPGKYLIRVFARNGMTDELLELPDQGSAWQTLVVHRDNKLLLCLPESHCETKTEPVDVFPAFPP